MNFIKLYIGDYMRDTGALTLAQHGAYLSMLMQFYATERPIPFGRELHRLLRADSKAEREAIDWVADRFWKRTSDGLVNERAVEEIARGVAQREINREIGKRGGRPKQNQTATEPEPKRFFQETESVTESVSEPEPNRKPNRNPNQTPDKSKSLEATNPDGLVVGREPADHLPPAAVAIDRTPHSDIVAAYHDELPMLPRVREWDAGRQALLRSRWRESRERQSVDWWREFFRYVAGCPFLVGNGGGKDREPFIADLEWLISPRNFRKVIEGRYEPRGNRQ